MSQPQPQRRDVLAAACVALGAGTGLLSACARRGGPQSAGPGPTEMPTGPARMAVQLVSDEQARMLNRLTWGGNNTLMTRVAAQGFSAWVREQLRPNPDAALPPPVQSHINELSTLRMPVAERVMQLEALRQRAQSGSGSQAAQQSARQWLAQALQQHARDTMTRHLLRAQYSRYPLHEQLAWFWFNHFNIDMRKGPIRALLADYEDHAIRPYALGNFRDLVRATLTHPAMLIYLDNADNSVSHINANYARALVELHMLGPNAGHTQRDVQELARVLTGVGVNLQTWDVPPLAPRHRALHVRDGLFEFHPERHDWGRKELLGTAIVARGMPEVARAIDRLMADPACARHVCRKLAVFFVADQPPTSLVEKMALSFRASSGDIAAVMLTLIESDEWAQALPRPNPDTPLSGQFKDPMHYVLSALRLAYDDSGDHRPMLNTPLVIHWLSRLAQGLYQRQTPDGYPMGERAWASAWQMRVRGEIARSLGGGIPTDPRGMAAPSIAPDMQTAYFRAVLAPQLSAATRQSLDQARSVRDWNIAWLTSAEFMLR